MGDEDETVANILRNGKLFIGTDFIFDEVQEDTFSRLWNNANYGRDGSDFWNDSNVKTKVYQPGESGYHPPGVYIDAGYVMREGVTITREQFENMEVYEWHELTALAEKIPNLICEEILEKRLMWLYTATPIITMLGVENA